MSGRKILLRSLAVAARFFAVAAFLGGTVSEASAWRYRREHFYRATGPTHLGPFLKQAWDREWGYPDAWPYAFGANAYPATDEWYPWGYVAPFVRVGGKCVANEVNVSPGGEYVRYQRVRPSHYCY